MTKKIKIVEVGPRDGLQNEIRILSIKERLELIRKLSKTGLKNIEVGAMVSPKWVPQMADSNKIMKSLTKSRQKINYSCLVPNLKGFEIALKSGAKEVAIFAACSESFSQKNINCSIEESFERFEPILEFALKKRIRVRGYLSTVIECPFDGATSPLKVVNLAKRLLDMGCFEVSLGDTIGVGTPKDIDVLLKKMKQKRIPLHKLAMHFHNTRGTALANVLKSLDHGIRIFDSSIGGLGGCPYAPGAMGNLATEDLVYMLERMDFKTGVDLKKLIQVHNWTQSLIGHPLSSHLGKSGV